MESADNDDEKEDDSDDNDDDEKEEDSDDNDEKEEYSDDKDEKEEDSDALSITQGKCRPANMQHLRTFSPAGPPILYAYHFCQK